MHVVQGVLKKKKEAILEAAAKNGVKQVRLFGSAARGEATASSDFDFLVTLEPGKSLLDLIGFKQELEDLLNADVDVVSENGLSPYLKNQILAEAIPL